LLTSLLTALAYPPTIYHRPTLLAASVQPPTIATELLHTKVSRNYVFFTISVADGVVYMGCKRAKAIKLIK